MLTVLSKCIVVCWNVAECEDFDHLWITTSNVTGCHRGPKPKLRAGYRAPSLKRTSHIVMRFHRWVWYDHTLSLCYVCIQSFGIILIPWATFVSNFVSVAASIAELVHGEKSHTQSITSLHDAPWTEAFASEQCSVWYCSCWYCFKMQPHFWWMHRTEETNRLLHVLLYCSGKMSYCWHLDECMHIHMSSYYRWTRPIGLASGLGSYASVIVEKWCRRHSVISGLSVC